MFPVIGLVGTAYYFFHFLILLPILGKIETPLPLPTSISEAVTKRGGAPTGAAAATGGRA
jgi:ubiquinol-cytochrome c reductase cytochrome b subunit